MGKTVSDVAAVIDQMAPRMLQEEWDNSGLLIGFEERPVTQILTCLELNEEILEEAISLQAEMIVTHHPLIFQGLKQISAQDYKGRMIQRLIEQEISVYSCHTPFDKVKGGNNDDLLKRLGLTSIKNLKGNDVEAPGKMAEAKDPADIGRMGKFKKNYRFKEVIDLVSRQLDISLRQLHAVGALEEEIRTVGICTGSGAEFLEMAKQSGCQLFLTGDVKYHQAQTARELGLCLLDAGHYHTEKFFGENMAEKLEKKLGESLKINVSGCCLDPFIIL